MFLSKVKLVVLVLMAQGLIVGGGVWWHAQAVLAGAPPANDDQAARTAPGKDERRDLVDVVSARQGVVDYLGTEITVKLGEKPPPGAFQHKMYFLITEAEADEKEPKEGWITINAKWYRPLRKDEEARPGKVRIHRAEKWFLPVKEGTTVEPGQTLAHVDAALAIDELSTRLAKLEAAEADRVASGKVRDFYRSQLATREDLFRKGSATREEVSEAKISLDRYAQETITKGEQVKVAARELRQAETVLLLHQVRSRVRGVVTKVYKHPGEGVRDLEAVLQVRLEDK